MRRRDRARPACARHTRPLALLVALLIAASATAETRAESAAAEAHPKTAPQARPHGATTPRRPHPTSTTTVARYRIGAASEVDLGWTGIAHRQPWPTEQRIEFALACGDDGTCSVHGGSAGDIFGAPVPLSSGGVPVCVVSRLREPLTGEVHAKTGCGDLRLALTTMVHTADDVARPCPVCVGDRTANDGRKGGHCDGGASPGTACDVNGESKFFGATSNDCLPARTSAAGSLTLALALTTGSVEQKPTEKCRQATEGDARCFCAGQAKANACDTKTCGADETCDGPADGLCTGAPYRSCEAGSGERDCEGLAAGAGTCEQRMRRCFGDHISAAGTCDAARPTYVAIFCATRTAAPAINDTAGLPGPARLRLALEAIKPASAPATKAR